MTSTPTLGIRAGRATISLQRPEKRNRIEPDDITTIIGYCETIDSDNSVRSVVLTATGPVWCSGYHLGALAAGNSPRHGFSELCDRIEAIRVPTIACLGGSLHGGGTDLGLSCDFRVGTSEIGLVMPAARIGLQYYASGLRRFVERIGPDATKRLFLTGERIESAELLRLGYLTEVVSVENLESRVDEIVDAVSAMAPLAVIDTKAAINQLASEGADLAAIEAGHVSSLGSHDHREAMAALKERRPARFTGH